MLKLTIYKRDQFPNLKAKFEEDCVQSNKRRYLLDLRGNLPGSSSRKRAIHLYRFDCDTLFSPHHFVMVMSAERQRSMRPANMSLRCALSIAASPNRLVTRKILRQQGQVVKTR